MPRPARAMLVAFLVVLVAGALAACGEGGSTGDRVKVVASTGIAADIVREVGGPDAEVTQLVPDSSNAHSHQLSARDRKELALADLVVVIGRNFEAALELDDAGGPVLEIADHVGSVRERDAHEDGHVDADNREDAVADHTGKPGDPALEPEGHAHEHHEPGDEDPHVWMDPLRVAAALPAIAGALAEVDPEHATAYARRAAAYARRLRALDCEVRRTLARVPDARRKLVTSHDNLGYFADRYDFEITGAAFGTTPEAEASARDVAELTEKLRASGVPAVFAQRTDDLKVLRRVADAAGVTVVDDLLVEGFSEGVTDYEALVRHDARLIAQALSE